MAGQELLDIERSDAWFRYLEDTRGQNGASYLQVEPWAWHRLRERLAAIRAREKKLAA